jgi:dissimilatory sulfite reductase (desulfoviridin) alpha/beta subunit
VRIAGEGEAVRILGAWLGNKMNASAPWEPIIDKINKLLKFYGKFHPTLEGRKVIAQIIIGGYTQYLTKVQGMPKHIEKALTKITRDFI